MSKNSDLVIPHVEGIVTPQAHVAPPQGSFERELGRDGFSGAATHVYHRNPPTAWISFTGPSRPRAFRTSNLNSQSDCPFNAARVMSNANCKIRYWNVQSGMRHLVRNADGDDLLFVHSGTYEFFCDYGHLSLREGDYLMIPRGTMWRIEGSGRILMIEATGQQYRGPDRGLLGRHSLYDPGVMSKPALDVLFQEQDRDGDWEVRVKRNEEFSRIVYPFNPLDAVGWKGDLYPVRLNIEDFRPVISHRLHLAPSVHSTFAADRFVVCTVVPRPFETDPQAMRLPWFHNNDDYDEVMFLHRGNFSSRGEAVGVGDVTLHPVGGTHGPHPEALARMFDASGMFEGWLVMVDTLDAMKIDDDGERCESESYAMSWRDSIAMAPDATG